ncbi:MAG: protein kinase [Myxococcales bacterium]|nr:protein kinase [Myxococcales bacterium]
MLHKHLVDDPSGGQARLLREARARARVIHPNVVSIYEVGTHEERVFLAMEHIEGVTLRAWLDAAPRPTRAILDVFIDAARGLAAAHAAGLVHRDFKPENVVIDRRGRARVLDFGLVGPSVTAGGDAASPITRIPLTPLTGSGVILGRRPTCPRSSSAAEEVTATSDHYSLCVALYEAFHGHRPTDGALGRMVTRRLPAVGDRDPAPPPLGPPGGPPARPRSRSLAPLRVDPGADRRAHGGPRPGARPEPLIRLLIAGVGVALALVVAILWLADRRVQPRPASVAVELDPGPQLAASVAVELDAGPSPLAWSRNGEAIARGERDGSVALRLLAGETSATRMFPCGDAPIVALALSADATTIAAADRAGALCLWRRRGPTIDAAPALAPTSPPLTSPPIGGVVAALALDPTGTTLALADLGGRVVVLPLALPHAGVAVDGAASIDLGGPLRDLDFVADDRLVAVDDRGVAHLLELRRAVDELVVDAAPIY